MFDIGFPEFFLAALVALLVLGPERLPGALRTLGLWIGRLRRSYYHVKTEIEREIGMDDVRRQLHNEQVMADVKRVEREIHAFGDDIAGTEQAPDGNAAVDLPNGGAETAVQASSAERPVHGAEPPATKVQDGEESGAHGREAS